MGGGCRLQAAGLLTQHPTAGSYASEFMHLNKMKNFEAKANKDSGAEVLQFGEGEGWEGWEGAPAEPRTAQEH